MANENETPPVISKPFSFQLRNTSIHECDDVRRCLWRHIWRPLLHQDPTSGVLGKTMEHRINWQFQWLWLGKVQKLRISAWIENTRPTLLRQYGMKATIRVQTLHFSNTEIEYAFLLIININKNNQTHFILTFSSRNNGDPKSLWPGSELRHCLAIGIWQNATKEFLGTWSKVSQIMEPLGPKKKIHLPQFSQPLSVFVLVFEEG